MDWVQKYWLWNCSQWVSEWLSSTAFLGTADIGVHIVHTSTVIIAFTLESLSSLTHAIENIWWYANIGSDNGLVPSGNKPLLKPLLTQIYIIICITRQQWVKINGYQVACFGIKIGLGQWNLFLVKKNYNRLNKKGISKMSKWKF